MLSLLTVLQEKELVIEISQSIAERIMLGNMPVDNKSPVRDRGKNTTTLYTLVCDHSAVHPGASREETEGCWASETSF